MSEFFYMHGYAPYIWGSYGVCALLLAGLFLATLRTKRALKKLAATLDEDKKP